MNNIDPETKEFEEEETTIAELGMFAGLAAFILVVFIGGEGAGAAIPVAVITAIAFVAIVLYIPGEQVIEVGGMELGAPGRWGLVDEEEEVSE